MTTNHRVMHGEELRRTLMQRRHHLISQVAALEDDLGWLQNNVEIELLEEGQEAALAGVLERLDEHDRLEIEAIERALQRLRSGRYGVCETCGKPIPAARQAAMPTADRCRPCAERQERAKSR